MLVIKKNVYTTREVRHLSFCVLWRHTNNRKFGRDTLACRDFLLLRCARRWRRQRRRTSGGFQTKKEIATRLLSDFLKSSMNKNSSVGARAIQKKIKWFNRYYGCPSLDFLLFEYIHFYVKSPSGDKKGSAAYDLLRNTENLERKERCLCTDMGIAVLSHASAI